MEIRRPSHLHNGISYTGKMTFSYWIRSLLTFTVVIIHAYGWSFLSYSNKKRLELWWHFTQYRPMPLLECWCLRPFTYGHESRTAVFVIPIVAARLFVKYNPARPYPDAHTALVSLCHVVGHGIALQTPVSNACHLPRSLWIHNTE